MELQQTRVPAIEPPALDASTVVKVATKTNCIKMVSTAIRMVDGMLIQTHYVYVSRELFSQHMRLWYVLNFRATKSETSMHKRGSSLL